jgi:hypothetical protein
MERSSIGIRKRGARTDAKAHILGHAVWWIVEAVFVVPAWSVKVLMRGFAIFLERL